jgi:AraC family transcriptional regulator, positive regulator of tynA and feaB
MDMVRSSSLSRTRVAAWAAQYCAQFDRAELSASDAERFDAQIQVGVLGALRFARLRCAGSAIDRRWTDAGSAAAPSFTLIAQLSGTGTFAQYGQRATLSPGDLALCDNAAPHTHTMNERSELVLLRIPASELREHLPAAQHFCGRRLPASEGMTSIAASLVENLCRQVESGLPDSVQDCLARQVMEMIGLAFTHSFDRLVAPSSAVGGRLAKARLFIEQNLRDPELGPRSIAMSLKVSSRYLRMIFASADECVSSYVLRRRLEETARQLSDPRWRGRSICEIAFGWGFNSAPHFSRSFRERYGVSPRQYRARHSGLAG